MKKTSHLVLSLLLTSFATTYLSTAAWANQKFIDTCISSDTGNQSECKYLSQKLSKEVSNKERKYLIVLMTDDDATSDKMRKSLLDKELETVLSKLQSAALQCS